MNIKLIKLNSLMSDACTDPIHLQSYIMKAFNFSVSALVSLLFLFSISGSVEALGVDLMGNHRINGGPIKPDNVGQLKLKWQYATMPDTGTANTAFGSISSTPAVDGNHLYFNDFSGNLTKLDRFSGKLIWKKNYVTDLSVPDYVVQSSRVTPYIKGNLIIVGSNLGLLAPLCRVVGGSPSASGCASGDGAIVLAIDKDTGQVVWRTKVDAHPSGKITGSISGQGDVIYVPVANWEEDFARGQPNIFQQPIDPTSSYPCCSDRGAIVAIQVSTGQILWKTYTVPGNDPDNLLPTELHALLQPQGFWGSSTYGGFPTIDKKRNQLYITTAQNSTAPKAAQDCEKERRRTGNPDANIVGLPAGVTCNNLNTKLNNFSNSIIALDLTTGKVKWAFHARKYDAWQHACGAPDFYGWGTILPIVFPLPLINAGNCTMDPIGPDLGFGHQPVLVKSMTLASGAKSDLIIAGNKDGRLFGLDPNTGNKVWETNTDPGGIYGGLQFGIAADNGKVFFGTTNTRNVNRKISTPFVPVDNFLNLNFPGLGLKVGPFVKKDGAVPIPHPAPSDLVLPVFGPQLIYGAIAGDYPLCFPDPNHVVDHPLDAQYCNTIPGAPDRSVLLTGPASGPGDGNVRWVLVNPPSDVTADGKTVFSEGGKLTTINGMVQAVDAGTGRILWQRPAYDGIKGTLGSGSAFGKVVAGNGLVFIGYADGLGTMVALDANTGRKLFEYHQKIKLADGSLINAGIIESAPQIVGKMVYWGAGGETGAYFPNAQFIYTGGGNHLYGFELPTAADSIDSSEENGYNPAIDF